MNLKIKCEHWKECDNTQGGCCAINKFERPSFGTCILACDLYKGGQDVNEFIDAARRPKPPSLIKQAKNYLQYRYRKAVAKIHGEETTVSQETYESRIAICRTNKCGKLRTFQQGDGEGGLYTIEDCAACGCCIHKKLWEATEKCPLAYWGRETS